jgi:hypothetical protein
MTNEKWWETWLDDRAVNLTNDGFNPDSHIQELVSEAERRGYERAMEEVMAEAEKWPAKGKETIFQDGNGARTVDGYFIPKSFFEKV